ncbi:VanZ family protein [Thermoactinospora rubra]|uniref:VanZ family protein n=1 Tax=Thermoactinospora rubra TaxID=1088767 RepID=UPI00146F9629|nr:VanZ family protein [Thermoactinospora rubra]
MGRTFDLWGHVVIAALLSLPLAAVATVLLARARARLSHPAPMRTAVADIGILTGTVPWIWMILTPRGGPTSANLVPLQDLSQVATASWPTVSTQVGGNLLVFAALGALLPVRSPRFASPARVALAAALASASVEALQYGMRLGRHASIDDVIVNAAGAVLAAMITRRWWASR